METEPASEPASEAALEAAASTDLPTLPFTITQPIRTERLILRLMEPADADDIYAYQSREDVCRYLLYTPRTREQVADRIPTHAAATTLAADGDYWQLAIEIPDALGAGRGRVIGDLYFTVSSLENSRAEIGWTLHPDFHGVGYASEAASAILDVAFRTLTLHRVVAELDPRNDASIALCKRLGLREEAFFVKDMLFKGDWADTGVYAILRNEWLQRQTRK